MKIVPQDKRYMQSPEFWNTPHNKKKWKKLQRGLSIKEIL